MSSEPILVTGATGDVGRRVVTRLLRLGHPVRALVRGSDDSGLPPDVEIRRGDLNDRDAVRTAAEGATAVYLFPVPEAVDRAADGLADAGARRVVVLSSLLAGADGDVATGPLHRRCEDALHARSLSVTAIRPGAFMDNDLAWAGLLARFGELPLAWPDVAVAPVHTDDVAATVTDALVAVEPPPVVELTGPDLLSPVDRASILARAAGRPIPVAATGPDRAREALAEVLPADVAQVVVEATGWTAEHGQVLHPRSRPTGYRQWAVERAPAFV